MIVDPNEQRQAARFAKARRYPGIEQGSFAQAGLCIDNQQAIGEDLVGESDGGRLAPEKCAARKIIVAKRLSAGITVKGFHHHSLSVAALIFALQN